MKNRIYDKQIVLPSLFWDGESWVKAENYPEFTVFTDKVLSETLGCHYITVGTWRKKGMIPHKMMGGFPVYKVNDVLNALRELGYKTKEEM